MRPVLEGHGGAPRVETGRGLGDLDVTGEQRQLVGAPDRRDRVELYAAQPLQQRPVAHRLARQLARDGDPPGFGEAERLGHNGFLPTGGTAPTVDGGYDNPPP